MEAEIVYAFVEFFLQPFNVVILPRSPFLGFRQELLWISLISLLITVPFVWVACRGASVVFTRALEMAESGGKGVFVAGRVEQFGGGIINRGERGGNSGKKKKQKWTPIDSFNFENNQDGEKEGNKLEENREKDENPEAALEGMNSGGNERSESGESGRESKIAMIHESKTNTDDKDVFKEVINGTVTTEQPSPSAFGINESEKESPENHKNNGGPFVTQTEVDPGEIQEESCQSHSPNSDYDVIDLDDDALKESKVLKGANFEGPKSEEKNDLDDINQGATPESTRVQMEDPNRDIFIEESLTESKNKCQEAYASDNPVETGLKDDDVDSVPEPFEHLVVEEEHSTNIKKEEEPLSPIRIEIGPKLASKIWNDSNCHAIFYYQIEGQSEVVDDTWRWDDEDFVRLPLSSRYLLGTGSGWRKIEGELGQLKIDFEKIAPLYNADDVASRIEAAMKTYSTDLKCDFEVLRRPDLKQPLIDSIPTIVELALNLPNLLGKPVPILKSGRNATLFCSRLLAASLLANGFFSMFPSVWEGMPDINFYRLFHSSGNPEGKAEKLKCILNYFCQISKQSDLHSDVISYSRRCIPKNQAWGNSDSRFTTVEVEPRKKIEDAVDLLQADFANKVIGGAVLSNGWVMEEILFSTCPELILSRLFCPDMNENEAIVIEGALQYSNYTGYASTFKFSHSTDDILKNYPQVDKFGRRGSQVVAMDAVKFNRGEKTQQFQSYFVNRELHKAFVAFSSDSSEDLKGVATGNWGCGNFNGDPELKFILQWMAASQANRPKMVYHTIGDLTQTSAIQEMTTALEGRFIREVYSVLKEYHEDKHFETCGLFRFIKDKFVEPVEEEVEVEQEEESAEEEGSVEEEEVQEEEEVASTEEEVSSEDESSDNSSNSEEFEFTTVIAQVKK